MALKSSVTAVITTRKDSMCAQSMGEVISSLWSVPASSICNITNLLALNNFVINFFPMRNMFSSKAVSVPSFALADQYRMASEENVSGLLI